MFSGLYWDVVTGKMLSLDERRAIFGLVLVLVRLRTVTVNSAESVVTNIRPLKV